MKIDKRGSLTVEAALICPLFIIVMLFLNYVIIWFDQAALVQTKIVYQARIAAVGTAVIADSDKADSQADIIIPQVYKPEFISVYVTQKAVIRPFTGVNSLSGENEDPIVYVTPKGTVYHYDISCSYINIKTNVVSYDDIANKRNKSGGKYKACEACSRSNNSVSQVYITDYGDRYHSKGD